MMKMLFALLVVITVSQRGNFAQAATLHWVLQRSNTTLDLDGVSCASASECVATGGNLVLRTINGGATWKRVPVPYATAHPAAVWLRAIRCPAPGICSIVAGKDVILHTLNGGRSWQDQHVPLTPQLAGISGLACPTSRVCLVTASPAGETSTWFTHSAAIFKTADGGRTWRRLPIPSSVTCPGDCGQPRVGFDLQWISCQNAMSCRAGGNTFIGSHEGYAGAVIRTDDGGATWRLVNEDQAPNIGTCPTTVVCTGVFYLPGSPNDTPSFERSVDRGKTWASKVIRIAVNAIACAGPSFCELAGDHGSLAMSIDSRIFTQASPAAGDLTAIACPRMRDCYAVGANGTILARKG